MLEATAAILPARDFDETSAFYARIGFRETGRWEDHRYMILLKDKVEIHFFGHRDHVPEASDHGVYIRNSDVDAWNAQIAAQDLPREGIPRFHPVEDKDWGMRELAIIDPNGNLLRVGQFLDHG